MSPALLPALLAAVAALPARAADSCQAQARQQELEYRRDVKEMADLANSWRVRNGGAPKPIPVAIQSQGDAGRTSLGELLEETRAFIVVSPKERWSYRLDYRWEHKARRPIENNTRSCGGAEFALRVYDPSGRFVMDAVYGTVTVEPLQGDPYLRPRPKPIEGLGFDKAEAMVAALWVRKVLKEDSPKARPSPPKAAAGPGAPAPAPAARAAPAAKPSKEAVIQREMSAEEAEVLCSTVPANAELIEKGIKEFDRLIAAAPEDAALHAGRARCHEARADRKDAREDFDRAVELEPGEPFLRLERARYIFKVSPNDTDESLSDIETAVQRAGSRAKVHGGAASLLRYMAGYLESDWEFAEGTRKDLLSQTIGGLARKGQAEGRACLRLLKEGASERPACHRIKAKEAREACLKELRSLEDGCQKDLKSLEPIGARFKK